LSFAAIEALLCEGSGDKTPTISSYVPALFQPNPFGRTRKGDVLRKYYGFRSKQVHGSSVEVSQASAELVRRIAAGVVRQIISWRDYRMKCGHPADWKEFASELKQASGDGTKVVGVDVDLSELLPEEVEQ
jgi:hypothetical protein